MKKRLEGAALELLPGLTRPGPCEPEFWKNDLPANLFLLHVLPVGQSLIKLHRLFNISNINTHFDICFEKLRHVIYFLVCVRKHESNLPTNIHTTVLVRKKTQWYIVNLIQPFWVKPHSCLILWQRGVFSFSKVCVFWPMVFYHVFYHNSMFLWFLWNSVGKKIHTLPCQGMIWFSLSNITSFTLAFMW